MEPIEQDDHDQPDSWIFLVEEVFFPFGALLNLRVGAGKKAKRVLEIVCPFF